MTLEYYSFDKIYSFNATYMFLIGARGLGKTYGAKKKAIAAFLRNGEQFIYLRRYSTELRGRGTFFADIQYEFPDTDFRVNGQFAQCSPASERKTKHREWETLGYFVQLSNAQAQKSVAYPKVTTIIFDEFIIEKGALHYLPDEAKAFNDFYSTVDRWKDKTRVLFLANAVSIMNPYFLEYGIEVNASTGEFVRKHDGFIVCHFADSAKFATGVFQTNFGRFIQGTEYANYSVDSSFKDNTDRMVGFKPKEAKYAFTLETRKGTFSVWGDSTYARWFIQEKRPKAEVVYTLVPEWMGEGKFLMTYTDRLLQMLRSSFKGDRVRFDSPRAFNTFVEIFRR